MTYDENNYPDLPDSWNSIRVVDACEVVSPSVKVPAKDYRQTGRLAIVDQGATSKAAFTDDLKNRASVQLPVVVFGDHTRVLKYVDFPFAAGADGIKILQPKAFIHPKFFFYSLRAVRLPDKGYARHHQYLRSSFIPLPPLDQQQQIADKLDVLLARVDACRAQLERVPPILRRFRQAVLAAAVSGGLTEEWREENPSTSWLLNVKSHPPKLPPDQKRLTKQAFRLTRIDHTANGLPSTWCIQTIADLYNKNVLIDFADGNHGSLYPRREHFGETGVRFLTATQIGENWELWIDDCPRLQSEKARQLVKGWARSDDVLLTHNATVGRVALLSGVSDNLLLGTSVTFYRFNQNHVLPRYARILFSSPFFQEQLSSVMEQTTRNQVPITTQVSLHFVCPPIAEQHEIVRRVETLFIYADRLEARYAAAREQVEQLTLSLLAKAFRGELVV